ncbi:hypothetical protein MTR_1g073570 [Medicago truncatula]|uniref:Uncharacterized protein n=1 Tax=Medicago truncatula TaxID=3880 RepID=A0A072VMK8_MEDTR|nr:hypothetical protein MTR_1g073570 [Medicago truncatula]
MTLLRLNVGTTIKVPISSLSNCSAKPFATLALGTTAQIFSERSFANAGFPIRSFVNRKIFCSLNEDNLSVGTTPSQPSGFSCNTPFSQHKNFIN